MKNYSMVQEGTKCTLTVFDEDGGMETIPGTVPYFDELLIALRKGDDRAADRLLNVSKNVAETLTALSERVSATENRIFFDGDPINSAIADHILRALSEGGSQTRKLRALVNFLEKVQTNPNEHSREHLYRWAVGTKLTITPDGDFLAYKGINKNDKGVAVSVHAGAAYVNNVLVKGKIPNVAGDVITMPRSDVQFDPAVGCSTGLHAGTWAYASSFGNGGVLLVKINPRDVVSVPTDCADQKLRVCRYEVLEATFKELDTTTYSEEEEEDDEWYCVECGEPCDEDEELCDECASELDDEWGDEDEDEDEDESPAETAPESKPQQQSPKRGYTGWGWGIGYI